MTLHSSQTPILLIILIIISSIIGGLILVICTTIICKHCYKIKLRRERNKSYDETISKSQSTITVYRNRKTSRIDSVTATEVDEESITALVKKYKDTIDQDQCDQSNSTGSAKNLFKVITPTKDINTRESFSCAANIKHHDKVSFMKDSSCQTFITLKDVIFTQRYLKNNESNDQNNSFERDQSNDNKSNEMCHIVPPTDYRRNSQHLRPFDTHWGSHALSRSFDQMPDKNLSNGTRKTYSFDECESNEQPITTVIRTNSFDSRYQSKISAEHLAACKKQISITSGHSSRTSSSISTVSISQNYHDSHIGSKPNKYANAYTRVRSCSRLAKDMSSVNSSFNSSSETNNCVIRSSHEINRSSALNNSSTSCRRKCNSERSPVRKVVVTRVTSKSLESRENTWQQTENVEQQSGMNNNNVGKTANPYHNQFLQKQHSECYPSLAKYPSSQYRKSQFSRHKSMDVSRNINDRHRSKASSYCRINSDIDKNQMSTETEDTMDRNAEPHLSRIGLVNISVDNSEYQFNNLQVIPDVVNSAMKDEMNYRNVIHKVNRNPYQNLCRSNTNLETSNNLSTTAAARRRQFSQERRKVDPNRKDSIGSLSKSVYDDYSSFMLDNLDDKKGKSMIFDRFFNSQMTAYDNIEPKMTKVTHKHQTSGDLNDNKEYKMDEFRASDDQNNFIRLQQRIPTKYLRSKSQNQDSSMRWNNPQVIYNDMRTNMHIGNEKDQGLKHKQFGDNEFLSKSIDRTIPTIIFPENE